MKAREKLKILLLQIREDKETKIEEYDEFVRYAKLSPKQIDSLNVFDEPAFSTDILSNYDALFIGGSSDATVRDITTYPFVADCQQLIRVCYEKGIPVLASCFGFQLAISELGGEIILDKQNMEIGMHPILLSDAAKHDSLLHDYPDQFFVISGHKERAASIPANAINLASSTQCPFHLVKFKDKPFYCFQFHPEIDKKDLLNRVKRYQKRYMDNSETLQAVIDGAVHDTSLSNRLVTDFVERIILPLTHKRENIKDAMII